MLLRNLQAYLHAQIPLSRAMAVQVRSADLDEVVLNAPLPPNVNHHQTAFGGSVSALAILSAWSLVHVRLHAEAVAASVVIQRSSMEYDRPISGPFTSRSTLAAPQMWDQFRTLLNRRGKARVTVLAVVECNARISCRFSGEFVALLDEKFVSAAAAPDPA